MSESAMQGDRNNAVNFLIDFVHWEISKLFENFARNSALKS